MAHVTRWNSQIQINCYFVQENLETMEKLDFLNKLILYGHNILKELSEILTPFETAIHKV